MQLIPRIYTSFYLSTVQLAALDLYHYYFKSFKKTQKPKNKFILLCSDTQNPHKKGQIQDIMVSLFT